MSSLSTSQLITGLWNVDAFNVSNLSNLGLSRFDYLSETVESLDYPGSDFAGDTNTAGCQYGTPTLHDKYCMMSIA